MTGTVIQRLRDFVVRGMAVLAVVLTYALGGMGTQILNVAGISSLALTSTASPAQAQRGRERGRRRRRERRRRWW
jgi:hypothetical protein